MFCFLIWCLLPQPQSFPGNQAKEHWHSNIPWEHQDPFCLSGLAPTSLSTLWRSAIPVRSLYLHCMKQWLFQKNAKVLPALLMVLLRDFWTCSHGLRNGRELLHVGVPFLFTSILWSWGLNVYVRGIVSLQSPSEMSLINCTSPRSWRLCPGVPNHSIPVLKRRHPSGHIQQMMGKYQGFCP